MEDKYLVLSLGRGGGVLSIVSGRSRNWDSTGGLSLHTLIDMLSLVK